jgi:hypothetical protein
MCIVYIYIYIYIYILHNIIYICNVIRDAKYNITIYIYIYPNILYQNIGGGKKAWRRMGEE